MKKVKIVFVQADKKDFHNLSQVLSNLPTKEYFFILVPVTVNVLSKKEVLTMLSACKEVTNGSR